jgi:MraZ protein
VERESPTPATSGGGAVGFRGFLGTHTPKLDAKGRLFFPARWREKVADGLVMTVGKEKCIYVYRQVDFEQEGEQLLRDLGQTREARDFERMFYGRATDDSVDAQGRLVIPPHLRAYAGLDRDVVIVGARTRAEIWDAGIHEGYFAELDVTYAR